MLQLSRKIWRKISNNCHGPTDHKLPLPGFSLHNGCRFLFQKRLLDKVGHIEGDGFKKYNANS
jgi:hypothetical protein